MRIFLTFLLLFTSLLFSKETLKYSIELASKTSYAEAKNYYIALPDGVEKKAFLYPIKDKWSIRVARTSKLTALKSLQKKLINTGYKKAKIVTTVPEMVVSKEEIQVQSFSLVALSHGEYKNIINTKKIKKGVYQLRIKVDTTLFKKEVSDLALYVVLPEGTKLFKQASTFNSDEIGVKKIVNIYIF